MLIEFEKRFKIHGLDVECKIHLPKAKACLISGPNGIGKSSFIQFLKIHQTEFFKEQALIFVDQFPLHPLNQISFKEIKDQLQSFRHEENSLFEEFEKLVYDFENKSVRDLSGGQKQLVKILIGLYLGGDIFIFDEPLQYLDQKNMSQIVLLLKRLKQQNKTLLIVEHQSNSLEELIDHKIVVSRDDKVRIHDRI